jgi:hypothetical protein
MSYLTSEYDIQYDIPALSSEQIDTVFASSSLLGGPVPVSSTYTINTSNTGPYYNPGVWSTTGTQPSIYTTSGSNGTSGGSLQVKGDAEFEGKVKINGQDLAEFMETMSKRLAILVPDPKKLEHFKALQKAYDHYKTLEALCQLPDNVDDK